MLSLSMTAGNDNQLMWVVRITHSGGVLRYVYWHGGNITLSNNIYYYDRVLFLQGPQKQIPVSSGGFGTVDNIEIALKNSGQSDLNTLLNSAGSKKIELGVIWEGATLESQITWINTYYAEDIPYNQESINLFGVEESEFVYAELPYYVIQRDIDNGISYFTNAPAENYGKCLNIIYGALPLGLPQRNSLFLFPAICVDSGTLSYSAACHESGGYNPTLYKYIDSGQFYMELSCAGVIYTNNQSGCGTKLYRPGRDGSGTDYKIYGVSYYRLKQLGPRATLDTVPEPDQYGMREIPIAKDKILSFVMDSGITTDEIGDILQTVDNKLRFVVEWTAPSNATIHLSLFRNNFGVNEGESTRVVEESGTYATVSKTSYFPFALYTGWGTARRTKETNELPWAIDEVQKIEFGIRNASPDSVDITVHEAYIIIQAVVYQVNKTTNRLRSRNTLTRRGAR